MLLAAGIACGAAGDDFEPIPEGVFALEFAGVADDAQQGFLESIAGFVFISARDDEQELVKTVKIKLVKFAEGIFTAGPYARRERSNVRDGIFRRNLGHNGGAIQGR